jgi:hypothetical protein
METMKATFTRGSSTIQLEGHPDQISACLQISGVPKQLTEALSSIDAASNHIDNDTLELALDHAWHWFELHADHRMRALNFFVVSIAFLTAAFVTAIRFAHPIVSVIVCLAGLAFTLCFSRADTRIGELIKASETVLKPLQAQLAKETNVDALRISDHVEKSKHCFSHYSVVIRTIHITAAAMLLLGALYGAGIHFGYITVKIS